MNTLIIGKGEVGEALYNILKKKYNVFIRDKEEHNPPFHTEIIHICFPYFDGFEEEVKKYREKYNPIYMVIHSTVPVGTTRRCGCYHSPIRGVHPNLERGIKTFVKYLAPHNSQIKKYFKGVGIKVETIKKPETTELLKILDTTYYAWNILFCKEVKRICDEHKLDFREVYTKPNRTYNKGYKKLGRENVIRPVLEPTKGRIGGHCLIPNAKLLKDDLTKIVLMLNENYGKQD